ncbi:MAG: DUF4249 domain-containing protein [Saprospiraceae bacterium]|nr:DUF4249 domain-containing protein [Saprospiraceae bacterium]
MKNILCVFVLLSAILVGCDLEKIIEVELPEYKSELSMECYIEPNKPIRLTLTESVSYFDSARLPVINGALVVVSYNGFSDTLRNAFLRDSNRFYNYVSQKNAPSAVGTVFNLYVKDTNGREARATATILPSVPIDSLRVIWNKSDTLASIVTTLIDEPNRDNFYRIFLHRGSTRNRPESRTWFTDRTATNNRVSIGSQFEFKRTDTVIATLFHLSKEYYDFIQSSDNAEDANGSPFEQPSAIISNVKGGIGIFTTVNAYRDTVFLKK